MLVPIKINFFFMSSGEIHIAPRNYGIIDVYRLFNVIRERSLKPVPMRVSELKSQLSTVNWVREDPGTSGIFKPIDLIEERVNDKSHWERVQKADLSYPVIVFSETRSEMNISQRTNLAKLKLKERDLIDGLHRLAQAVLLHMDEILVYDVPWDVIEEAIVTDDTSSLITASRINIKSIRPTKKQ